MKADNLNNKCSTVYPGEYVPLAAMVLLLEKQLKYDDIDNQKAQVIISEYKDCFRFEVALPGANRENIFIEIFDNTLSIVVLHIEGSFVKKNSTTLEFGQHFMERYITLPKYADAEFISAEYKQGILKICMPKTEIAFKEVTQQIVVY
jgi:HSP20 family protein